MKRTFVIRGIEDLLLNPHAEYTLIEMLLEIEKIMPEMKCDFHKGYPETITWFYKEYGICDAHLLYIENGVAIYEIEF